MDITTPTTLLQKLPKSFSKSWLNKAPTQFLGVPFNSFQNVAQIHFSNLNFYHFVLVKQKNKKKTFFSPYPFSVECSSLYLSLIRHSRSSQMPRSCLCTCTFSSSVKTCFLLLLLTQIISPTRGDPVFLPLLHLQGPAQCLVESKPQIYYFEQMGS